jgi:biopolymer transport protein ExbD
MAEINTGSRRVARPDMTPMVDLGFLLITFFMFTTTFSLPYVMDLAMPKDGKDTSPMKVKNTLTLILGKENRIFWHQAIANNLEEGSLIETTFSPKELRTLLISKNRAAEKPENFTVIIKPTDESSYENLVDILDEMAITKMPHYSLVDISSKEVGIYKMLSNRF